MLIQYSGESETSTSGEFVISGGTGNGELMGTATGDYAAWHYGRGPAGANESYYSNFVYPGGRVGYQVPVTFSFTFGVPFTLTLSDEMDFYGSAQYPYDSDLEDITLVYTTLAVFDSNGNPLAGAIISSVPEISSAW